MKLLDQFIGPRLHHLKMVGYNFAVHRRLDLPDNINIEVSKACNRRCHYCPQSVAPFKQEVISEHIWNLFKARLAEYGWRGAVVITKYSEVSLVTHSERYVSELAAIGCKPMLFTNGDRPDVLRRWIEAGAFRIIVTEHPPFKEGWREPIAALEREFSKVMRVRRLDASVLHNQAGHVEMKADEFTPLERCYSAHALYVNMDGSCSMCCLDYYSKEIVGDIRQKTMAQVWAGYRQIRKTLAGGEPATEMCRSCFGLETAT